MNLYIVLNLQFYEKVLNFGNLSLFKPLIMETLFPEHFMSS